MPTYKYFLQQNNVMNFGNNHIYTFSINFDFWTSPSSGFIGNVWIT